MITRVSPFARRGARTFDLARVVVPLRSVSHVADSSFQDLRDRDVRPIVGRVVLMRHGQSVWNVTDPDLGTTARFTGWADVGLTERGARQAAAAGRALRRWSTDDLVAETGVRPIRVDSAFCSSLSRSERTMRSVLRELGLVVNDDNDGNDNEEKETFRVPIVQSWRLNERHYGDLVGLSKIGAERQYGKEQLDVWRNDWSTAPPPMSEERRSRWARLAHCRPITRVRLPHERYHHDVQERDALDAMPATESFRDAHARVVPIWTEAIAPRVGRGEDVLVVAHANTIRALLRCADPRNVTQANLKQVRVPSAVPLVLTFRPAVSDDDRDDDALVVDGGLVPLNHLGNELTREEHPKTKVENDEEGVPRLNGFWIEDEIMTDLSFCSDFGRTMGEQEIA